MTVQINGVKCASTGFRLLLISIESAEQTALWNVYFYRGEDLLLALYAGCVCVKQNDELEGGGVKNSYLKEGYILMLMF